MKLYKLVNVLGALNDTNKLASDMYDLGKKHYYSESHGQKIPISEMDFQHLVRSFIKLCDQEEMLDRSKHMGRTKDLMESVDAQEKIIEGLRSQVETLQELVDEKDKLLEKETKDKVLWKDMYYNECTTKGHRYVFSEIPNDEYGKKLTRGMKVYLNNESYNIRVRGQHLKKELYGQGRAYHGANIEDCTHLRVYIDNK
tara:strand:+ start:940 stop:1536 length:597 start_codon:yes stop_codon:yes gene_type:complete